MIGTKRFQLIRKSFVASLMATVIGTSTLLLTTALISCGSDGTDDIEETKDTTPPSISLHLQEVNVLGGKQVKISGNKLSIGTADVASWTDNSRSTCTAQLTMDGATINNLTTIDKEGTLKLTVTDPSGNASSADIKLTASGILGLESLKLLNLQVDEEVNLLEGITFGNGTSLTKVQIEIDGGVKDISDPTHFIPDVPGTCNIILITKNREGKNEEHKVENLTIKPLDYTSININYLNPSDIIPKLGKINIGDKNVYKHIENLGIAPGTVARKMMQKYGAGNLSPSEFQQYMLRLHTGSIGTDKPQGYNNFEYIGTDPNTRSEHDHITWDILYTISGDDVNYFVVDYGESVDKLLNKLPKNSINIFGTSAGSFNTSKDVYEKTMSILNIEKFITNNTCLLVDAVGDIRFKNDVKINELRHENLPLGENSAYMAPQSHANSKDDKIFNKHLLLSVGVGKSGDEDMSNHDSGSLYPEGFKYALSGRAFPYETINGDVVGQDNTTSSYPNYTNLGMINLCFQMDPTIKDIDELMKRIIDTSLTDHIHLNGRTQDLILISPANYFIKYCMPTTQSLPVKQSETKSLEKGSYKGIVFNIPGAEVNINGQWIAFDDKNRDAIMAQNPFSMKWRISGVLLRKLGYKQGDTVKGQFVTVDDKWSGLSFLTKEFTVTIE